MATKQENRLVDVKYCDYCGEETGHLSACALCKKEMCPADGGGRHAAYSMDVYRYGDGKRLVSSHVCRECSGTVLIGLTIKELFDGMLGKVPVQMKRDCDL